MIRFLRNSELPTDAQRALDLAQALNRKHQDSFGQDAFLEGRIASMESAFKMQFAGMVHARRDEGAGDDPRGVPLFASAGLPRYSFSMPTAILKAHYDGERIVLDEPFELKADAPLMVTVLAPDAERSEWAVLGVQGLARAYGDNEPDYTAADLKPQ